MTRLLGDCDKRIFQRSFSIPTSAVTPNFAYFHQKSLPKSLVSLVKFSCLFQKYNGRLKDAKDAKEVRKCGSAEVRKCESAKARRGQIWESIKILLYFRKRMI